MTDLTSLTDEEFDDSILRHVRLERESTLKVLLHLREAERRRLFSKFKYSSLQEYAMKHLGYTEDEAGLRISAMRLLRELPSIQNKIECGSLSLTNLAKARSVFRQENKANINRTVDEKLHLIQKLEHSSKREAELTLQRESLVPIEKKHKPIALEMFSLEVQVKLKRIMNIKGCDLHEAIGAMSDLALSQWDPLEKAKRARSRLPGPGRMKSNGQLPGPDRVEDSGQSPIPERPESKMQLPVPDRVEDKKQSPHSQPAKNKFSKIPPKVQVNQRSRYIPAAHRHATYVRDQGKCQRCGSDRRVEPDHIIAFAQSGTHELNNLRLLCRSCNERAAIEKFGMKKMSSYLKTPTAAYG